MSVFHQVQIWSDHFGHGSKCWCWSLLSPQFLERILIFAIFDKCGHPFTSNLANLKIYQNRFPFIPTLPTETTFYISLLKWQTHHPLRCVVSLSLLLFRDILDCSLLYCLFQSCPAIAEQQKWIHVIAFDSALSVLTVISYTYRTHLRKVHLTLSTLFPIQHSEPPYTFSLTLTAEQIVWQCIQDQTMGGKKEIQGKKKLILKNNNNKMSE